MRFRKELNRRVNTTSRTIILKQVLPCHKNTNYYQTVWTCIGFRNVPKKNVQNFRVNEGIQTKRYPKHQQFVLRVNSAWEFERHYNLFCTKRKYRPHIDIKMYFTCLVAVVIKIRQDVKNPCTEFTLLFHIQKQLQTT